MLKNIVSILFFVIYNLHNLIFDQNARISKSRVHKDLIGFFLNLNTIDSSTLSSTCRTYTRSKKIENTTKQQARIYTMSLRDSAMCLHPRKMQLIIITLIMKHYKFNTSSS